MHNEGLSNETVQKIISSQQLHHILDIIVEHYTHPTRRSRSQAKFIARWYAITQRDYWAYNTHIRGHQIYRQIWTDALVLAATQNDWSTLEQAMTFDQVNSNPYTQDGQQRFYALENLSQLL